MAGTEDQSELEQLWEQFHSAVNMTSRELLDWIGAEPDVKPTPGPAAPPPLGMAVVGILGKRRMDLTADDLEVMRKVVSIVAEETAEDPPQQVAADERKRNRLLNVGHDVLRER